MPNSYLCTREDLKKDNCHSFWKKVVLYQRKQSTRILEHNCKKDVVQIRWKRMSNFFMLRPHWQRSLKSKSHGKLSIHYAVDQETIETIFRIIVSENQLSLYGAVAKICEEYESLPERTGRSVVMGQSSSSPVLSAIKTKVPLDCDDPINQYYLSQQFAERIEKLSQQDKLSKFCMDARFLNVHEIGQYLRTKNSVDLYTI